MRETKPKKYLLKITLGILLYSLAVLLSASAVQAGTGVFQVSTIDALLAGVYDGAYSVKDLKAHGDFGLGTFDALDGEMIVSGGVVYQVRADGSVHVVPNSGTTPFAAVTTFDADTRVAFGPVADMAEFKAMLTASLPDPNAFYAVRATGRFTAVKARSVPRQAKPYPPLAEVVKKQSVFALDAPRGEVIGFYCPGFVKGVNVPGFHLHFLRDDKQAGGHILDLSFGSLTVELDELRSFSMVLPGKGDFAKADLTRDRAKELEHVESNPAQ